MKKNSGVIKFKISLGKFQADINLDPPQKNILALTGKSGSCLLYTSPSPRD